ncbi:Peptidyl-prolyl cis-trans isomerase-like 2 [Cricetulus griseus]|nr:Peptidyl-prolyl cis-trans isomerase-like 2 [Cricetulus griseus]
MRTTGNVYTYEAVQQLNIKAKNLRDLLTDVPFSRQDIITLQDPTNLYKFNFQFLPCEEQRKVSASFTSTAMVPETTHEAAVIDEDVLRYQFVKKKGYVRLHTNKGDLHLELHCDLTPKTRENFIKLARNSIITTPSFTDPSGTL